MPFWNSAPKPPPNSESTANTSTSTTARLHQEKQADEDLAALLREFSSPSSPSPSCPSTSSTSAPHSPALPGTAKAAWPATRPEEEEALKESLNCLRAFDELFYCYSLGGQFLNVYRYGSYRDCGEKTDDWLFCLRAKVRGGGDNPSTRVSPLPPRSSCSVFETNGGEGEKEMVLARNREKAAARYGAGPSSEDVWSARKTLLVNAFSGGDVDRVPGGVLD